MKPQTFAQFENRTKFLRANSDTLTIDADMHPTDPDTIPPACIARMTQCPDYFHTRPLLSTDVISRLDAAKVDMGLCWQNPAMVPYTDSLAENALRLTQSNRRISELARRHPTRIIPAGWTDPKALGVTAAIKLARLCVSEFAMSVVKMNPAQNAYPIDDPMVLEVVDAIVETGAIPAFHFGADTPYTPTSSLETVARRHPDHPVIAVHMGGGGGHFVESEDTCLSARAAGLRNPNIFYVLSAKRDAHIVSDLITYAAAGPPFSRNIACGSDAPYADPVFHFAGFRALLADLTNGETHPDERLRAHPNLIDSHQVQNFLGGNFADLIIAAHERILARSTQSSPGHPTE